MIDFTEFFASLDNDQESIEMIFQTYLDEYRDCHVTIEQLFRQQQWQELFILVHSVKGILASFGADAILPILEQLEQQAKAQTEMDGELVDGALCQQLAQWLPTIQTQIEQQVNG